MMQKSVIWVATASGAPSWRAVSPKLEELAEEFEVSRERVRQSATNAVPSGRRAQRLHPHPHEPCVRFPNVVNCWKSYAASAS
jgi:hypothetical protein